MIVLFSNDGGGALIGILAFIRINTVLILVSQFLILKMISWYFFWEIKRVKPTNSHTKVAVGRCFFNYSYRQQNLRVIGRGSLHSISYSCFVIMQQGCLIWVYCCYIIGRSEKNSAMLVAELDSEDITGTTLLCLQVIWCIIITIQNLFVCLFVCSQI